MSPTCILRRMDKAALAELRKSYERGELDEGVVRR